MTPFLMGTTSSITISIRPGSLVKIAVSGLFAPWTFRPKEGHFAPETIRPTDAVNIKTSYRWAAATVCTRRSPLPPVGAETPLAAEQTVT